MGSLSKQSLDEAVAKLTKKLGREPKDVNLRDFCAHKWALFDEMDKITGRKGHTQLDNIRVAADMTEGDFIKNLDEIVKDYERKSQVKKRSNEKVNAIDTDQESTDGNADEEVNAIKLQGQKRLDSKTVMNNSRYVV